MGVHLRGQTLLVPSVYVHIRRASGFLCVARRQFLVCQCDYTGLQAVHFGKYLCITSLGVLQRGKVVQRFIRVWFLKLDVCAAVPLPLPPPPPPAPVWCQLIGLSIWETQHQARSFKGFITQGHYHCVPAEGLLFQRGQLNWTHQPPCPLGITN